MGRYRFGNYDFPGFPTFDNAAYPYLHIARFVNDAEEELFFAYAFAQPGYYITAEDHVASAEDAPVTGLITSYDAENDEWRYIDDTIWLGPTGISAYPPVWTSYDMYDDSGALHMAGSAPLLILDEDTLKVGISIGMSLKGKGSGGSIGGTYVVGDPVTFTLAADSWNGTMYTLYAYLYAEGESGAQIGLPSDTSTPNAQAVIEAALTLHSVYTYAGSDSARPYARLRIIAAETPTEDLEIAIFGLTPVADTVVATASEETVTEETTTEGTE